MVQLLGSNAVVMAFVDCGHHSYTDMFFDSSDNHLRMIYINNPPVTVDFQIIQRHGVIVETMFDHSGYITVPFMTSNTCFNEELKAPSGFSVMISVQQTYLLEFQCSLHIKLIYKQTNASEPRVTQLCVGESASPSALFFTSSLQLQFCNEPHVHTGLRIHFSAHSRIERPGKLASGMFNCCVSYYSKFSQHLDCNFKPECEDGQDETEHCPFSSPACQGLVASQNKCFKLIPLDVSSAIPLLAYSCRKAGGNLASIKSRKEQDDSFHLFKKFNYFQLCLGYTSGWDSVPFMYSKFQKWSDGTIVYNMNHFFQLELYLPSRIVKSRIVGSMILYDEAELKSVMSETVLCEIRFPPLSTFPPQVLLSVSHPPHLILRNTGQVLSICPERHLTHSFLPCSSGSQCGEVTSSQICIFSNVSSKENNTMIPFVETSSYFHAMFKCDGGDTTVPYTLVCDFQQDCPGNSDEAFCEHPFCTGFLCSSGQCISLSQRCNEYSDCLDDTDEMDCHETDKYHCFHCPQRGHVLGQQIIISLDGAGYFSGLRLKGEESCPDSHYRCTAELLHCLPVYTRCNRLSDCLYGEDERDCETVTCSGLYQCQASRVCVHGDHLCDGWAQLSVRFSTCGLWFGSYGRKRKKTGYWSG
ncbi:hypothetical protein ACOMHN_056774 [Nucella lapillus]